MNRAPSATSLVVILLLAATSPCQTQVTFSAPVSYTVGINAVNPVITGDFNGDEIPDLAVANIGDSSAGDPGSLSLLLGNGDGTFRPALDTLGGPNPGSIFPGDFNGDGKLDLLVLGQTSSITGLMSWNMVFGNGDGTFTTPSQINSPLGILSMVVGDFNSDKKLDLVFMDSFTGIHEMLGNGDGTFQSAQDVLPRTGVGALRVGDFNGDGKPDLLLTLTGGPDQVLLGNGSGTFRAEADQSSAANVDAIVTELNHDGRTDLIASSVQRKFSCQSSMGPLFIIQGAIQAYVADVNGNFQPVQQITSSSFDMCTGTGNGARIASVGDFDGDGNVDVIVIDSIAGLQLFAGHGDGTFTSNPQIISGSFTPYPSLAVDLNGDELVDPSAVALPNAIVVLNTTQTFSLEAPVSIGPLKAGGSTTGTVSANPRNGFSNPVTLTCSPSNPTIHCSLSPSSIGPGTSSTLTVTTTGNSASLFPPRDRFYQSRFSASCLPFFALVFLGVPFGSRQFGRKGLFSIILGCMLLIGIVFQIACGGGNSKMSTGGGTPAGGYTITVTATSGTTQRSRTVNLTVQ